jgi:phospholipid/cholesterol/gamma-HCH transport system substrate-binding protein
MQKQAPSITQLVIIAGFTLSCFGLLLFLWISFGGPTPLRAKGYTFRVPFKESGQLADQSDVRISGVSVGKVTGINLGSGGDAGSAVATVELSDTYAPIPDNTRAILRQKTLLGETYVELTPGDRNDPNLPDGGELPAAQVAPSVELDEIFRTFNAKTRVAFQNWMADAAVAFDGRGPGLNTAFGLLEPTFTDANKVVRVLDTQRVAVGQFVRNTGVVLNALSARQGQLQGLIRNSNAVFQTTAQRSRDLQDLFRVLPTFLDESQLTLNRLDRFAANTNPLVTQLRPAARNLAPVLKDTGELAPILRDFFIGLKPVIRAAPKQFPALRKFLLKDLPPFLGRLDPFFQELDPLLQAVGLYKGELAAFLGNAAAATNSVQLSPETGSKTVKLLRTGVPLGPDSPASYPKRLLVNRPNPYVKPGGYRNLNSGGIRSFETAQCATGINAILRDWTALTPAEQATFTTATGSATAADAEDLYNRIKLYAFVNQTNSNTLPAPPCTAQGTYSPLGQTGQPATKYLHVFSRP